MELILLHCGTILLYLVALCCSDSGILLGFSLSAVPLKEPGTVIEPDSCLSIPNSNGEVHAIINTVCACRMNEPGTGQSPEWFDKQKGKTLASGLDEARLHITVEYLARENSIVCRVKGGDVEDSELPLPPLSDSPMKVNISFNAGERYGKVLYTSQECPTEVSFTCATSLRNVLLQAYPRASIAIIQTGGRVSTRSMSPYKNRTNGHTYYFDYSIVLRTPGHVYLRCVVAASIKWSVVEIGFDNFMVTESTVLPKITANGHDSFTVTDDSISAETGDVLNLVCYVPTPWSFHWNYIVQFQCGSQSNVTKNIRTTLHLIAQDDLHGASCLCSINYTSCGGIWSSNRRIYVLGKSIKTALPQTTDSANGVVTFANKSGLNATDAGSGAKENDDDNDDNDGNTAAADELPIILVVVAMSVMIFAVAILCYCIGFKAGSKNKKRKYSVGRSKSPAVCLASSPDYENVNTRVPVEDAYGENIKMVSLKPNLVYSLSKDDYLDPMDPPLKIGTQAQELAADESYYASPKSNRTLADSDSKQDRRTSSGAKPKVPSDKPNHFYDNSFVSKLHSKLRGSKNGSSGVQSKAEQKTMEDPDLDENIYIIPGREDEPTLRVTSNTDQMQAQETEQYAQCDIYENEVEGSYDGCSKTEDPTQPTTKEGARNTLQVSDVESKTDDGLYVCPSNGSALEVSELQSSSDDAVYEDQSPGIYERPSSFGIFSDTN